MEVQAVLLANDHAFERLQRDGLLPPHFLLDQSQGCRHSPLEGNGKRQIPRFRPEQLTLIGNISGHEDEQLDYLMAALLDRVICHLVLIGGDAAAGHMTALSFAEWYQKFSEMAARIAPHRRHYRHVVIAVAMKSLDPDSVARLQALLTHADSPIAALYFMSHDLELGERRYFHARHVWPIAVSHLLLRLASVPLGPDEEGRMIAWRARQIEPAIGRRPAEEAFAAARSEALSRYKNALSVPDTPKEYAALTIGRAEIEDPKLEAVPAVTTAFWQEFGAIRKTAQATNPDRWLEQFQREGQRFIRQRSRRMLSALNSLDLAIADRWSDAHRHPANLYQQQRQANTTRPDIQRRASEVRKQTEKLVSTDRQLRAHRDQLQADSVEFEKAAGFYLEFALRMLAGVLAAAAIIWASHLVYAYFGLLRTWLIISSAAVVGAMMPMFVLWLIERFRGEHAVEDLLTRYRELDELTSNRFRIAWELFDATSQFNLDLRTFAAWRRMQRLLERATSILDVALEPTAVVESVPPAAAGGMEIATSSNQATELKEFQALTRRLLPGAGLNVWLEEDLVRIVDSRATEFCDRWSKLCERSDPEHHGTLMAHVLRPYLSTLLYEFHAAVGSALTLRFLQKVGRRQNQACMEAARETESAAWHYGMSAPVPDRGFPDVRRLLLLNPALRDAGSEATQAGLAHHACQGLDGCVAFAIAYDEIVLQESNAVRSEGHQE